MNTLIVFATAHEAAAYKTLFPSARNLLITGMGMESAHESLTRVIENYDSIINAGVVGAIRQDLPIGTQVDIKSVTHEITKDTLVTKKTGFSLLSVLQPLYSTESANSYDLVDMEGYAIASLCKKKKKQLTFIKVISDHCNPQSHTHIKERLPLLSQVIATHIVEFTHKSRSHS